MFSFIRRFVRVGVIGAILLGTAAAGAVLVAGPGRARAVVSQVHGKVLQSLDAYVDDPAALRTQLEEMERGYPKRIAQVRGDLAEIHEQIRQLEHEYRVSTRVVALADQDLERLEPKLAEATARAQADGVRLVSLTFDNRVYSLERAASRLRQIKNTRMSYAGRAADAEHDLGYLNQQSDRLEQLLQQLESEQAQFRSQIVALSRQVDAIARNERLIHLLDERNETIERCSRYEAVSLDQITGHLAEIRSRQEAELNALSSTRTETDYEDLARLQIEGEKSSSAGDSRGVTASDHQLEPYRTAWRDTSE